MSIRACLVVMFLFVAPCVHVSGEEDSERPNIVWISIEDMSPWLGCYGDSTVPTPHVDALSQEAIRFTHAYATTPVCAPSRATLITGMYATSIGAMHMRTGNPSSAAVARNPDAYKEIPSYEATPPANVRCFPELLRQAGYYCTNRSKQDYQFKAPLTVWDESSGRAHWRHAPEGQPFFAVFNIGVTHESGTFPERKRQPRVAEPASVSVPPYFPDTPTVRADIARTYDNIAAMDRQVGQIVNELKQAGLWESTIVFLFSDHGVGLPRGKRSVYNSGTHVPLLVRLPNAQPRVETRLVSFVDYAPTVLSLAGCELPSYLQGHVFIGASADPPKSHVFFHADRMDAETDRTRAVTDGRYRYIRNFKPDRPHLYPVAYAENIPMMADLHALRTSGEATDAQWQIISTSKPREELYDTLHDPHEIHNLIDDASLAERCDSLRAALHAWIERTGDLGMMRETEMVRTRLWPPAGEQPATATPQISRTRDEAGRDLLAITCGTKGASIGYRFGTEGPWRIYHGPIPWPGDAFASLQVTAHRIGYVPSRWRAGDSVRP